MATILWSDVVAIAPGDALAFNALDFSVQNAILGYATGQCDPDNWGELLMNGIVYLAAHLAKIGLLQGTGAVTSESIDRLSRAYQAGNIRGPLNDTSYGREYKRLLRLTPATLGAVY